MTLLRRVLVLSFAIIAAVGVGVMGRMSVASSATAPVYSYTVSGSDAHPLDPHVGAMFTSGGGVEAVSLDSFSLRYLEVGLNLPVGAKVTSIAASYTDCYRGPGWETSPSTITFGSYAPTSGSTVSNATLTGTSCTLSTLTKTGNPIVTTVAGRRYVVDYNPALMSQYPGEHAGTFNGATVKYTCTSPCVP